MCTKCWVSTIYRKIEPHDIAGGALWDIEVDVLEATVLINNSPNETNKDRIKSIIINICFDMRSHLEGGICDMRIGVKEATRKGTI